MSHVYFQRSVIKTGFKKSAVIGKATLLNTEIYEI